ncbi:molybdopterin molybdotransferase MoeA [soil metagenome]
MTLLPVAEAQARLLALAPPLDSELLPLEACIGRWLTGDVIAGRDQPWADLSAMDGYAIRHDDLPGPWIVSGESAAGNDMPPALSASTAMRIFTGAPMPQGADTVVIQEDVVREGKIARLIDGATIVAGASVRKKGSDFQATSPLLAAGTRIGPAQIALAALGGHGALTVGRRPRIVLLSSGSELVPPGSDVAPGKLPSSNALMLKAMLSSLPCDVEDRGIVPDDLDAMTDAFVRAQGADIIVTTGGASVGDHDLVRPALDAAGGALDFWKIAMRPGKPLIAGHLGTSAFVGLPGNPVSAFATATLFLLPLVRALAGCGAPLPPTKCVPLGRDLGPVGARTIYLNGRMDEDGTAWPLVDQDSAGTRALAKADCFIVRPATSLAAQAGDRVTIILIS